MAAKNVTVIPATRNPHTGKPKNTTKKRRVTAYARVSTDSDEQYTSYEAQVKYYTDYIKRNPDWEYVDIYTDEGISGLMTKHREGFNQMVQDALDGKIDLIITKSVSRFARNTVDSLTTVRKLKEAGVEVYFEKENIYTLDSKGELLITIMSSLAQEESRSISENVTWGQRKRFADGKVRVAYARFLGYRKGPDGQPEIVPEEAEIVRRIYREFVLGKTAHTIAADLTDDGIPTPGGKKVWDHNTVRSILRNEKYKGAALLQKRFTTDFLTKKQKINEGEVPQYYVENSHPAIIDPAEWDRVQYEITNRKTYGKQFNSQGEFSGIVFCGDCGSVYGSKIWHSNDRFRREVWQCTNKYENEVWCTTPHFTAEKMKTKFVEALSMYFANRKAVIEALTSVQNVLTGTEFLDADIEESEKELSFIADSIRGCVMQNASADISEEVYKKRYEELNARYEEEKTRHGALLAEKERRREESASIGGMLFELTELEELPIEFSDKLFRMTVKKITIYRGGRMVFCFKDGSEVELTL